MILRRYYGKTTARRAELALRECGSFQLLKKERPQIEEVKPYSQDELNRLLNQAAKPLYFHLIDCEQCSLEDARYCSNGMTLGSRFDDLLLCLSCHNSKTAKKDMGAWVSSTSKNN